MIQHTLALIKRDAVERGDAPAIKDRIISAGLVIVAERPAGLHELLMLYEAHERQPYYERLMQSVLFGSIALLLEGEDVIVAWRAMMGPTDPERARREQPNTIRAFFGRELPNNAVHGSGSRRAAFTETGLFFSDIRLPEGNYPRPVRY